MLIDHGGKIRYDKIRQDILYQKKKKQDTKREGCSLIMVAR